MYKAITVFIAASFLAAGLSAQSPAEQPNGAAEKSIISDQQNRTVIVLFPIREAVVSSIISANVKEYMFKEGEAFSKGNVIVRMDSSQYMQANLKAKALHEEAKAALSFAEKNLQRLDELFKKSAIGFQEFEQGRLDFEIASSKLNSAAADLKMTELNLDACELKAPFDGRLTKKIAKVHEFVSAGQPLMEIIDDSKLLADMHLSSSRRNSVKIGDLLSFVIDETGSSCKGTVYEISGRIDYESRTFGVKVLIDNRDRKLSAGMSGILSGGVR